MMKGMHAPVMGVGTLVSAALEHSPLHVVAIDIPIGLADDRHRNADTLARKAAGPRWNSVFMTPVSAALQANDHPTASEINRSRTGAGISAQAYALKTKILQVDQWVRAAEH